MKIIKSKENPLIKEIRNLLKEREKNRIFLLEGKKLVEEALSAEIEIKFILINEKFLKKEKTYIEKFRSYNILVINDKIEKSIATVETSQGILAIATPKKIKRNHLKSDSIVLFLDRIKDPGNLGTIFRTSEAFGVERIYISPNSCSPFNTKVVRASAGSCLRLDFHENVEFEVVLKEIREKGGKIYSTSPHGGVPPWEINLESLSCLVVGSESEGLSQEIVSLSDSLISIPQIGGESLNVSISTSIILYEFSKKRAIR